MPPRRRDAVRTFNQRGELRAGAQFTDRVPPGSVWMHDGWEGINRQTPAPAAFPGGAARHDARVERAAADRPSPPAGEDVPQSKAGVQ